jgi:acyl-CoA synthetase (AMP-forming)/AMP-acid ligase II
MTQTLVRRLYVHLENRGDQTAFDFDGDSWSWSKLNKQSLRLAAALRQRGAAKGKRVAILTDSPAAMVLTLLANYRNRSVHLPINTRYTASEAKYLLKDSGAELLIADPGHPALDGVPEGIDILSTADSEPDADRDSIWKLIEDSPPAVPLKAEDDDTAMLIYTSGTTGSPKGVVLSHRAVLSGMWALTNLWEWSTNDVLVLALPLFHVHGLGIGIHGTLLQGNKCRVHSSFDPARVCEEFADGASIFMGVPTMYDMLLEHLRDNPEHAEYCRDARLFTSGSAALPASKFEEFEQLTGHRILERYGMSETMLTLSNPYRGERRPGTIGRPVPGISIRILDEQFEPVEQGEIGELFVHGDFLLDEYWNRPKATRKSLRNGWFRTGDIVRQREDGYIEHVGRKSADIFKSGGFKVSAREVEDVLREVEGVREIAVTARPDGRWGDRICAFYALEDGAAESETTARLQETADTELANFKRPREWTVIDELPRNALGKVQKHRLTEAG